MQILDSKLSLSAEAGRPVAGSVTIPGMRLQGAQLYLISRRPQRNMEHRTVLSCVDVHASKHLVDLGLQIGNLCSDKRS